jgi:hypothetical protein
MKVALVLRTLPEVSSFPMDMISAFMVVPLPVAKI